MPDEGRAAARRVTIVLCLLAAILEGIDLQSIGVAASGLLADFKLHPSQLGVIGSASSVGLFFGAVAGGWLSDRVGRRRVLIGAVVLFGLFSLTTPFSWDLNSLIGSRFMTGLGLGAGLPMLIALGAEAAPPGKRTGTVTLLYVGTPVGGALISLVALQAGPNWRAIFYLGGLAPLLLAPLMMRYLKESPLYLRTVEARRAAGPQAEESRPGQWEILAGGGRALTTLLLWAGFFFSLLVLYLLLNWLPSLLVSKGFSKPEAFQIQLAFNVGGAIGSFTLGRLVDWGRRRLVMGVAYLAVALGLASLAILQHSLLQALISGFGVGVFANATPFVLYGLASSYYPTHIRGTGVGWAVAMGRMGSIAGPILAGLLVSRGQSAGQVLWNILPVVVLAGVAVQGLLWRPSIDD